MGMTIKLNAGDYQDAHEILAALWGGRSAATSHGIMGAIRRILASYSYRSS